jgi:hypothetical protein
MKRALLLGFLAMAARADGAPKIEFDRTVYDFGTTSLVESVTGTFTFRNAGDGLLTIEKPKPTCGCTVAKVSPETLKPGEKGELVFTIKLGTFPQTLAKEILVPSNDPLHPVVELGIKVALKSVFEVKPPGVSFGGIRLGATTNATVVVRRTDGRKLVVTKVEATSDLINVRAEPLEGSDGKAARVLIGLKAQGQPRLLSEQVRVYTEDSMGAALTIFVGSQLLGDLQLEPQELVWGIPDPNHWSDPDPDVVLSRTITVTSTQTNHPLHVRNLSCDVKDTALKLVTLKKGEQYQIVVRLLKAPRQPLQGTIRFETNLPSLPKVEVPLTVNIWTE